MTFVSRSLATLVCLTILVFSIGPPRAVSQEAEDADPSAEAGSGAQGWTPELAMRFRNAGSVAVSPEGDQVAYTVRDAIMDESTSEYRTQIWIVASDGSDNRQLTRGEHSSGSPAFSPDGRYLAFTRGEDEAPQVFVLPLNGGEAMQVTDAETGVRSFKFSPHGSTIAYTMTEPKSKEEKAREKEKRDVQVVDEEYRYAHLFTTDIKAHDDSTRTVTQLTGGERHVRSFDWMPDGSTVVFAHQPAPTINSGFTEADISSVPADSGAVTTLVERPGVDGSPLVSPDGSMIAFTSNGGEIAPVGLSDVYVMSSDGSDVRQLGETLDRQASIVGWMPDGDGLLTTETQGTTRPVFDVPLDGSAPMMLLDEAGVYGSAAVSDDGTVMAFTHQTTTEPEEVFAANIDGENRRQLSKVNVDIPKPEMGRTEVVSWESSDGFTIEGLITYPVGYEDGDRVPLVVDAHGGPNGAHVQDFTGDGDIYMAQVFAENGYAVLRPNVRGSAGYGKDFRYANVRDWGYGDLNDIMTGVDAMIERDVAHPDSLVLMGWSYGGYMTSFAVTQTDRFQAASMGAGLPNLISMVGTTDIPDYLVAHMGGEYWTEMQTYEKHSAVYHIDNVTTPTQVLHGAQDDRVPTRQGQEFYRALKRRGIDTEMVLYPRTPHGPREPKLLMDVTPRILDWFNEHLNR
ncbi:S9 family peptidase [Longibacter salinarum]|nr:S9 family peptidase [Longibacter salinarum]